MTTGSVARIVGLGAVTGMRSMAGPAALALPQGGAIQSVVGLLAAAEMIADKTPAVGDRIDPLPLAARAAIGGIVGGVVAHEERVNMFLGALLGASTAIAAAHLAYYLRKRIPGPSAFGGLVEDAVVVALAGKCANG